MVFNKARGSLAAARRATVSGVTYNLPVGLRAKIALDIVNLELPQGLIGQEMWVPVTRIETLNWKHREVFSDFRSCEFFQVLPSMVI